MKNIQHDGESIARMLMECVNVRYSAEDWTSPLSNTALQMTPLAPRRR